VDPTAEDPWDFLVYEPKLGFLTAQFDRDANRFDPKGHATVEILGLNRRGAVAVGLRRSYRRISEVVSAHLLRTEPWPVDDLAQAIILADEHGLIEWCFRRDGRNDPPFSTLREREPDVWTRLIELLP
jgi:hypothetical protein